MRSPFRFGPPSLSLLLLAGLWATPPAAQVVATTGAPEEEVGPGLQFNGLGRTFLQQTELSGEVLDPSVPTVDRLTDGNFVLDLDVNARPNRVTEVQGTIRLRNEFGGFFGAGATVEIRELWARGVVANRVRYRLGDLNLRLTPFTVFLPDDAATVNEPAVFEPLQEVVAYEEFYTGLNERRFQGGTVDFRLGVSDLVDAVDTRLFLARLRATDFRTTPNRLIAGGRVGLTTDPIVPSAGTRLSSGVNLAYTFDDLSSGEITEGIRNTVWTLDGDLTVLDDGRLDVHLVGEGGWSEAERFERAEAAGPGLPAPTLDPTVAIDDFFYEVGVEAALADRGLSASAVFMDVGPDFFSVAAQSKRVDYTRALSTFNRIGPQDALRAVSLFDLTRDPALYTSRVAESLMAYDPRFDNVLPYGRATPNRRGVRLGVAYAPEAGPVGASAGVDVLREIRGSGTTELKDFVRAEAAVDVAIGRLAGTSRRVALSLGGRLESTSRGGVAIEQVDLDSRLLEAGLEAEVYDRLDVLLGVKHRASAGNEYVPQIADFNRVRDFPGPLLVDDRETLLGGGLRYRFGDGVYLTVQAHRLAYGDDRDPAEDYRLGQVFALYSMPF